MNARTTERTQSGTWSTVRYAVKVGKPVTICYPDGRLESRLTYRTTKVTHDRMRGMEVSA